MGYRDEEEGLRMRVGELEGELADAEETIARLRGEGAEETSEGWGEHDWLIGGPRGLHLERELPFDITEDGFEAIAEVANQRVPGGSVSQVGRTLTHRVGTYELRVTLADAGRTTVRVVSDYQTGRMLLPLGGIGIGILGGGFLGGIAEVLGATPPAILSMFVVGAIAGFMGLRALLQRGNANDRQKLTGLYETVCDLAKEHRVEEASKKRIAVAEAAAEVAAEEEAMAAEEAAAEEAEELG